MNLKISNFIIIVFIFSYYSCVSNLLPNNSHIEFASLKNNFTHKICDENTITIDSFLLINNQWGKSKIRNGKLEICTYFNQKDKTIGWEWFSPRKSYGVIAFPEIWYGSSAWQNDENFSDNNKSYFPKSIGKIYKLQSNYNAYLNIYSKSKYNLCYDVWIHKNERTVKNNIICELMIWEDYYKFLPHGTKKELVNFSFGDYYLYQGFLRKKEINAEWNYVCFQRKNKRRSGTVDFLEVLQFMENRKLILPENAISSVEFGTEILNSSGSIFIKNYNLIHE